ncbi:hypothetical protein BABINDRAFT_7785 [Babjeviella inositovora NRRL Y-12698]|uniref:Ubiquinone biosynthesis monooxygenase COQ6, mitochondrial n=1 Tax=Babjeviella inositovora NRRL Y-12698 TaxID=984486 RepID=A0A1E3QRM1_9ASCO|nr:uncharacterized protein BABINDRAFT_7785 [Babjeviella inositovora NRRL Y-12698]ODQ80345.1 hypothetical protein BABINDRAFT_7785 [Babjeviella inositovora NRRL Y-12698]
MALAERRPLGYAVSSPSFNAAPLSVSAAVAAANNAALRKERDSTPQYTVDAPKRGGVSDNFEESPSPFTDDNKPLTPDTSVSPSDLSPSSHPLGKIERSPSPLVADPTSPARSKESPLSTATSPGKESKKDKLPKQLRVPAATGISTTIPVTGERPKPERHASLEDDVLYAIFEILHEKDAEGAGMTVKQVCDILIEKHPDMAKLSSKTSNLVSAKLNAYVKRVEKGEKSLIYALSRDWADASPKRMVYVYRGLLAKDFHVHVQALVESKKEADEKSGNPLLATPATSASSQSFTTTKNVLKDSFTPDDFKTNSGNKQRRATMYDIRPVKSTFLESPIDFRNLHLSGIPYSVAPVTASLAGTSSIMSTLVERDASSLRDLKLRALDMKTEDESPQASDLDMSDYIDEEEELDSEDETSRPFFRNKAKRSKSMSALSNVKRPRPMTAAAAAPRIPRNSISTAEHAAVLEALSPPDSIVSVTSAYAGVLSDSSASSEPAISQKWLKVVRSGFLTQDIGAPEDISLSELDILFDPTLTDICIIGGGPAGLTLLTALKNSPVTSNLKCTLVEGGDLQKIRSFVHEPPVNFSNRVSSLTPVSVEFLEKINAWQLVNQSRVKYYDNIVAYDGLTDAKISFEQSEIATMCENMNLQSGLLGRIQELDAGLPDSLQSEILDNTRVTNIYKESDTPDDWPIVELSSGEKVKARLLIGADGFNSPVRTFAGIESRGWSYNKFGIVASLKLEMEDYRNVAWQRFLRTGPIALLPLPENNATLVWSTTPELSVLLTKISLSKFISLVNAAFICEHTDMEYFYKLARDEATTDAQLADEVSWRIGRLPAAEREEHFPMNVTDVIENTRARFPLKMSHADSYVDARIALVGDAAHTTHPLAGQGLNMGQGDVMCLVECLEVGMQRGLDIGNPLVLEPYFAKRYPENHILLGIVDKLHKIYNTDFEPVVLLRSTGLKVINSLGFMKDAMIKQISGR